MTFQTDQRGRQSYLWAGRERHAPYCWGDDYFGQLGDGNSATRTSPVRVAGGIVFGG